MQKLSKMVKKSKNLKKIDIFFLFKKIPEKFKNNQKNRRKKNYKKKFSFIKKKVFQNWSKNLKIWKNLKNHFKKKAIPLVLPIEEISLQPDLSRPPRFRIQGGWSERYTWKDGRRKSASLI